MISLPDLILPKIKHFGLSIERQSLHAVEVDDDKRPVRASEIQIPADTFTEGMLINQNVFTSALKSLISAGNFSTPYVAVTFPEVFAYTRGYTLPAIPVAEANEAVSWHAKELFPFPPEEIYFDWKILNKKEKEYQTSVVAVQKKILDPLVSAIISVGLKPLRFEPDASALTRLLTLQPGMKALLIEINEQGAYVTLVEGEKALFTTIIPYAKDDRPAQYIANIDQTLTEIASYYRSKGVLEEGKTQFLVTGGMGSADWVAHLSELLKYSGAILETQVKHAGYNKAYAAALQKIAPPIDEQSINLLPVETQSFYDQERTRRFYLTLISRCILVVAVITAMAMAALITVSAESRRMDTKISQLRLENQAQQANIQTLLYLNSQAREIVALSPLRTTPVMYLETVKSLLTDEVTITSWEYDDQRLEFRLNGTAKTREALLQFKDRIEKSEYFAKTTLPISSLEIPVNVPFTMTFLVTK